MCAEGVVVGEMGDRVDCCHGIKGVQMTRSITLLTKFLHPPELFRLSKRRSIRAFDRRPNHPWR